MDNWNENPNDDPWTGYYSPHQQMGRRRALNPSVIAVIAALILVAVLSTVSFGYFSLGWFSSNPSSPIAQVPTATLSLTATLPPTVTPSPTPRPSPTAKPSPAILAVTPGTYYFTNCVLSDRALRTCTFTLRNSSSTSPLAWTAKAWNTHGVDATKYLSATRGTLPKSGKTTVSLPLNGERESAH